MSPTSAAVVVLTLLSAFLPGSSFVRAPSTAPRGKAPHVRTSLRFSTPVPSSQHQHQPPTHQRICRAWRAAPGSASSRLRRSASGGGIEDIDPLEAGPDIDPLEAGPDAAATLPSPKDKAPASTNRRSKGKKVTEDEADAAAMAALAAAAKDTATKQQKKKKRKRADPFMPKGAPAPLEWQQFTQMEEGCRAHLVVIHSGLPEDQAVATSLATQVKERFGNLVNVHEEIDEDEDENGEEERRRRAESGDSNPFEVWLEGPESIVYHARAECGVDLTEEQIGKILDDLHERVQDEAILGLYSREVPLFRLQGLTLSEQIAKQFHPL